MAQNSSQEQLNIRLIHFNYFFWGWEFLVSDQMFLIKCFISPGVVLCGVFLHLQTQLIEGTGYANKDAKIYVGRSMTMHNLLFCAQTLYMNSITNMFLLVSSSVQTKQLLCFVHGQGQKREQQHTTKNFVKFYNHSPLLNMLQIGINFCISSMIFKFRSTIHKWRTLRTDHSPIRSI